MKLKAIQVTDGIFNECVGLSKKITDLNNKVIEKHSNVYFVLEWNSRVNGIYAELHYIAGENTKCESEHWYYDIEPGGEKKLHDAIERWEKLYV